MTTDNHILSLIDTYLTGGLDDAETRAFDAHVAGCGDCSAALEAARTAHNRLFDAFAAALPGQAFEDRLVADLRPKFARPSLVMRLSRPIRHPLRHPAVRRIAVGVAASLVIGTVGYGMSMAVDAQEQRQASIAVLHGTSQSGAVGLKGGIDMVGGTTLAYSTATPEPMPAPTPVPMVSDDSPERDLQRTAQLAEVARQQGAYDARVLVVEADKAKANGKLQEAYKLYSQAEAKDPENHFAKAARSNVASVLGLDVDNRPPFDAISNVTKQRSEEISYNFKAATEKAKTALSQENFAVAEAALAEARAAVVANPGVLTRDQARQYNDQLTASQLALTQSRDSAIREAEERRKTSEVERLTVERSRSIKERERTVEDLVATARRLTDEGKYKEAKGVGEQILQLEPRNDYALGVRPLLEDKASFAEQGRNRAAYDDILRYPADWPDVAKAQNEVAKVAQETDGLRASVRRLREDGQSRDEQVEELRKNVSKANLADVSDRERDLSKNLQEKMSEWGVTTGRETNGRSSGANDYSPSNAFFGVPAGGAVDRSGPTGGPTRNTTGLQTAARTKSNTHDSVEGLKRFDPQKPALPPVVALDAAGASAGRPVIIIEKESGARKSDVNGPVALGMNFSDSPNFNLEVSNGTSSGGGLFNKSGSGTTTLHGNNTYAGATNVNGGTLTTAGTGVSANKGAAIEGKPGESRSESETRLLASASDGWSGASASGKWYRPGQASVESDLKELEKGIKRADKSLADGKKLDELAAGDKLSQSGLHRDNIYDEKLVREKAKRDDTILLPTDDGLEVAGPDKGKLLLGGQTVDGTVAQQTRTFDVDGANKQGKTESTTPDGPEPVAPPPRVVKPEPVEPQPPPPVQAKKIIRNGVVTFEVDSFDSSLVQVSKLVTEEGGYVSTTSSDKLPNGKVRGSVTVRVPPDRLDTLVLKLRGMGDLKNQRITADDVTKRYTDIASQLRAAETMEKRLLAIIATGGQVKDLLEAEKQLGVWREKLELLQGEIKYYDNLVSLATLVIELQEREVRSPTAAFEIETVNTAVESEDVENVRSEVLKAIEQAKGRIIDSDLKKLEAGQLSATIKATVAPDAAGPVIDRLKQLGKLARFDISRKTETQGGSGPIVQGLRVEKKETQFEIHIYNLANIEPRQTTSLNLAAQDVEATYKSIIDQVKSAGGTIKTSQLNRPKADQTSGTIVFQAPSDKADVLLGAIRTGVDVMRMDVATNPDMQNTTEAKRGFAVQIMSLSHVPARETTTLQVAAADVPAAFRKLLDAATAAGGRVQNSQLNEQDANNITGQLEFETSREKWSAVDAVLRDAGTIISRSAVRSSDTESTVDSKLKLSISILDEIRLSPRETINATVATRKVQETFDKLQSAARAAEARVVGSNLNLADRTRPTGTLRFATPRENAEKFEQAIRDAGLTTSRAVARLPDGPMTVDNRVGFIVTIVDERTLTPRETHSMVLVAASAKERYDKLVEALRVVDALVINSQFSVQNRNDNTGTLVFVVNRSDHQIIEALLKENTDVFNRSTERSQDTQGTVDTKVHYSLLVKEAGQQPPRQLFQLSIDTSNIDKAVGDLEAAALAVGGRKIEAERSRQDRKDGARVVVDVPLAAIGQIITSVRGQGEVTANQSRQNEAVPEGALSRARIEVTYSVPPTAAADKGFGESLREGMSGALTGLFTILRWVIFGLVVIVPCIIVIWIGYQLVRLAKPKGKKSDLTGPTPTPA